MSQAQSTYQGSRFYVLVKFMRNAEVQQHTDCTVQREEWKACLRAQRRQDACEEHTHKSSRANHISKRAVAHERDVGAATGWCDNSRVGSRVRKSRTD